MEAQNLLDGDPDRGAAAAGAAGLAAVLLGGAGQRGRARAYARKLARRRDTLQRRLRPRAGPDLPEPPDGCGYHARSVLEGLRTPLRPLVRHGALPAAGRRCLSGPDIRERAALPGTVRHRGEA